MLVTEVIRGWRKPTDGFDNGVHRCIYKHEVEDIKLEHRCDGGVSNLFVEANLPRLLYSHNAVVLTFSELLAALVELERRIRQVALGADVPPLAEWELSRVDYVHDWSVPTPDRYIRTLQDRAHVGGRKKRRSWADGGRIETFTYGTQQRRVVVYDKSAQVAQASGTRSSSAMHGENGILRLEVRLYRKQLLTELSHVGCTVAGLVDDLRRWPNWQVDQEWRALFAVWRPLALDAALSRIASARLKPSTMLDLLGTFHLLQSYDRATLTRTLGLNRDTISDRVKKLKQLGVSCTSCFLERPSEPDIFGDAAGTPEPDYTLR